MYCNFYNYCGYTYAWSSASGSHPTSDADEYAGTANGYARAVRGDDESGFV